MNARTVYILDSSVFIQAARNYYAFDIASSFWEALVGQAGLGNILSIDRVKAEIDRGNDALKDWANDEFQSWFQSTDETDIIDAYRQLMIWANQQTQYTTGVRAHFSRATNADAWVIAYSMAKSCIVATQERYNPVRKDTIPIPNVCRAFQVQCADTFEMLRSLSINLG